MAAPPNKTINDLNGKWVMNKTLSDSVDPALTIQGINYFLRKAISFATVTLHVRQYVGPPKPPNTDTVDFTHVDIDTTATGGLKGTSENRCLDYQFREHTDWMFGHCQGQSKWMSPGEIEDDFLKGGPCKWLEGDEEAAGPGGKSHIYSHVESLDNGWTATQIWGFQIVDEQRYYCRHIVVQKEDQRADMRLVYDYVE